MPTASTERELIELPDFYNHCEAQQFVTFLRNNTDRYSVKKLLYHSEMILNHIQRIDIHLAGAKKILVRVNGSITPVQRRAYDKRAARNAARTFYSRMNERSLDNSLKAEGYLHTEMTRDEKIEYLIAAYVQREVGEE